jgi:hypothetical protein
MNMAMQFLTIDQGTSAIEFTLVSRDRPCCTGHRRAERKPMTDRDLTPTHPELNQIEFLQKEN